MPLPIDDSSPGPDSRGVPRQLDPNAPFEPSFEPGAPLGTAAGVLQFYRDHEGLGETPPNSNHNIITEWYGVDGPWCAMTVSRALVESGFSKDNDTLVVPGLNQTTVKGWAFVPFMKRDFENAKRFFTSDPQPGDIVIFDFEGDGDPDHVGVLEEDLGDGTFLTWEGNTSANKIEQKRRSRSIIAGFGRPPYTHVATLAREVDTPVDEDTKALIRDLHTYMSQNRKGDASGLNLDGVERQTLEAVKALAARLDAIEARLPK